MKKYLNRRLVLRGALATGAAVALPLPILEGMLNGHGTAYAAGEPLPKRFVLWFFGNGVLPPRWNPTTTDADWKLSDQLAPLASVKDYLTVVTGLENKFPGTSFHPVGSAAATTGGGVENNSAVVKSIDQLVAPKLREQNPKALLSYELGVSDATPNGAENTLHAVSHTGKNAPNYPKFDPKVVFKDLFGEAQPNDPDADRKNQARKSVLDNVLSDATELRTKLSTKDQQHLDAYMDGIRDVENGVGSLGSACTIPDAPTVGKDTASEAPKAVNDVMAEMLALALSCNRLYTASCVFTLPAAHVVYRHLGADMNDDFHDTICHTDQGDACCQDRVHRGVVYTMECLATLLTRMKSISEGAGNMLDNSLVYATSCTGWGKVHDPKDWPVLLAGKAGGALPGNMHVRHPGENLSKALFSIASLLGVPPENNALGAKEGLVNSGLSSLLT
ncbi:MAG TPA: DUF1552 domain-containing protein [Polyangiaceae bacterium]|nr:DUF1552 domain-containing protein [Polyangiaceae bacterium]